MSSTEGSGGPDSLSRRPSPPLPRARLLRALRWSAGFVAGALLSAAVVGAVSISFMLQNLPDIASLTDYRPRLPMRIFSSDGELLGEFGEERRRFMPITEIPKLMQDAVLAVEDQRFREHPGVDYRGVLRAGLASLVRPRSQGASTITMQVARNFYLPTRKDYIRKTYEILLALKIERRLTKPQILELYMNQIYLGQRAYGFAAASEIYFGKPLAALTVAEAAMLAGLPQSPAHANPVANPQRAAARHRHVLNRMRDSGVIDETQWAQARDEVLAFRVQRGVARHAEYVAETARQLIHRHYGDEAYTRGLNVTLTIDAGEQRAAYRALRDGILDFERRQPYRGPEGHVELPSDAAERDALIADALAEHPDNDELRSAVVLAAERKHVNAVLHDGKTVVVSGAGLEPAAAGLAARAARKLRIRPGSIIRLVETATDEWAIAQLPEVEGAFVAMDPASGSIRALVGGFDFGKNQFNHVTQAWRQPGSSLKPFIYSAALEKGFTPSTTINDAPLTLEPAATGGVAWEPKNSDGRFDGPVSMRRALAMSKNIVSVRILQAIGVPFAQGWLARFGFEAERHPPYLTMALGAGSVTPLQMASAYSVLANGGYRLPPFLVREISDGRGRILGEWQPQAADESLRAIDARNAFVTNELLTEVTRSGTASRAQAALARTDIAGKTGTTNDARDAWFAGFQRQLVAVAWMGYDTPRELGAGASGARLALPVWLDFMRHALEDVPVDEPVEPDGVVRIGDEWYFEEVTPARGIWSLGVEETLPDAPSADDRKSILDLFRP
ncbi:penicillin-binding protein 1A [Piscinibacter sp.]|uniref:penicillin-binding protein 1A n=1 Tax=Piscinibacter sp. TaxID=1903157 RepID=UPI002C49FEC9|nr:PBP1A family penicillin-binding protein [Albitalea sp.]HUG25718.1 PBP1A family penicillin-binding protein [Albitalea sp.]